MKQSFTCRIFFFFTLLMVTFAAAPLKAQICTGSLGDAVVNVTFGSGNNPGAALPASVTTYNFNFSDCPADGSYTVINATSGCFGSSWHSLREDHTPGDVNGYMMLINASVDPGVFFVDTVRGLCANTTYEFSSWILNVLLPTACSPNPIHPKLIFNIETITGQVLGTYSTGDIFETSSPLWKQYGLFFATPVNTNDVVIRIINSAPGGCGNDLALDDITFRPCGPSIAVGSATNNQSNIDLCTTNTNAVPLTATIGSGYISPSLQWQESLDDGVTWTDISGATASTYVFNKSAIGRYLYRLTAAEGTNIVIGKCRVASNEVTIEIHDIPVVAANSNSPVCENSMIQLGANGGTSYTWTGPAGFTSALQAPSFNALANAAGQYTVKVTDQFGCSNSASASMLVNPAPVATVIASQNICEGDSLTLSSSGGTAYLWSPATGLSAVDIASPVSKPIASTMYIVEVSSANGCKDTASVSVNVSVRPTATAGADKVILKGYTATLDGSATGLDLTYFWTPGDYLNDALLIKPTSTALTSTEYVLHVQSTIGCGDATDTVFVKVYNDIYIPNAFSPNGDGRNPVWRIESLSAFPKAVVTVFNRLGEKVYESLGNIPVWDGTFKGELQPAGTYVYIIDFKTQRPIAKGWLMLIR